MKLYEITTWLCERCLPDELDGIRPMRPDLAKQYRCERCGRGADDDTARETGPRTETE